jgi:hypothetical protein
MKRDDLGRSVRVSGNGDSGGYIVVPMAQLDDVKRILQRHKVRFWVDQYAISINGQPYTTVINLHRTASATHVRKLLKLAA